MKNFINLGNNTVSTVNSITHKRYGKYIASQFTANQIFFLEQGVELSPWDVVTNAEVEEFKALELEISIQVKDSVNRHYA